MEWGCKHFGTDCPFVDDHLLFQAFFFFHPVSRFLLHHPEKKVHQKRNRKGTKKRDCSTWDQGEEKAGKRGRKKGGKEKTERINRPLLHVELHFGPRRSFFFVSFLFFLRSASSRDFGALCSQLMTMMSLFPLWRSNQLRIGRRTTCLEQKQRNIKKKNRFPPPFFQAHVQGVSLKRGPNRSNFNLCLL